MHGMHTEYILLKRDLKRMAEWKSPAHLKMDWTLCGRVRQASAVWYNQPMSGNKTIILIVSILLGLGIAFTSQFLRPNEHHPPRSQFCYPLSEIPDCPKTITWTTEKGWPFAFKTLVYQVEFDSPSPTASVSTKTLQSDTFSSVAFTWSAVVWFGLIFALLVLRSRWIKLIKDPVVASLLGISLAMLVIYQVGGGDSSENDLVRNGVNFPYILLILVGYLVIRPHLQRSIAKSTSLPTKIGKIILGIISAIVIAALIVFILFILAFSLVL